MYFPLSWPKQLIAHNDDSPLACVAASYDRFLFAVLTERTVGIWFCKVNSYLLLAHYWASIVLLAGVCCLLSVIVCNSVGRSGVRALSRRRAGCVGGRAADTARQASTVTSH